EKKTGYKNAHVITSSRFKYFADQGPSPHGDAFPRLSKLIENLTQGSRVNHRFELQEEINQFIDKAQKVRTGFRATPIPKVRCERSCDQDDVYVAPKCLRTC